MCSFVPCIPLDEDDKKHITKIFTELEITLKESETKLKSYEDIFDKKSEEGCLIRRAVLIGLPGRGKSTITDKMAYDWAVKEALQKFQLVFLLKINRLKKSSDLIDSVFDQLLNKDMGINKGDLSSFIRHNQDKVLILLDGFDELVITSHCETSHGSIFKILNRKECRDCCVAVTTRPSHLDRLVSPQLVNKPVTCVMVEGFDAEGVKEYVHRFYSEDQDKANRLLLRIKSSDVLSDLARSPMILLFLCLLWKDNSTLPDTMFHIYNEALEYIFDRKQDLSAVDMKNIVLEIGKIGLHGLVPEQQLAFPEQDFEESVLDMALTAGVLTRQKVSKGCKKHSSIEFLHKTVQEFCAAIYLQSLFKTDTGEFQETMDEIMHPSKHPCRFEYLLRFCSGDDEGCTNNILQILQKRLHDDHLFLQSLNKLAFNCYFESQSKNLPPVEFIQSVITGTMKIEGWNDDCLNSFIYFLKVVTNQTKDSGNDYLAKVKTVDISGCNLGKFLTDLAYCMSYMVNLSNLRLAAFKLLFSDVEWFHYLPRMKNLQRLILNIPSLTAEYMKHIAAELIDLPNFVVLSLEGNKGLGAGSASVWCRHLQHMKPLQCLLLAKCSLTGKDMGHIADSLRDLPNFVELSIWGNNDLGGSASLWCHHLQHMKPLQKLDLSYCSLTGKDMGHIAGSLGDLPNFAQLIIWGNRTLGGCASLWCHHLQHMKHLHQLGLSSCSLTGEDMEHIAGSLIDLPNFFRLRLRGNTHLGGSAELWSHHLQHMKPLRKLDLRECSLTCDDMEHIAGSLSDLPNFVWLNLYGNDLSDSVELWGHYLKNEKLNWYFTVPFKTYMYF